MRFVKELYLENRLFISLGLCFVLFCIGFLWSSFILIGQVFLGFTILLLLADILWLFNKKIKFKTERKVPKILSLGDVNTIHISLENQSPTSLSVEFIDELPYQLQERDFSKALLFEAFEKLEMSYDIKPKIRGEYHFGNAILYVRSKLKFVSRRLDSGASEMAPVYPSILQMKKFQLAANPRLSQFMGIKKTRRIGHSYEFEQIKTYAEGDDYRSLNWKATGRHNALMVNQYQDERSQPVYCIIDKGRQMRLPFEGLSLMDHAINTSLVISNVALQKKDRAGLITFSRQIETIIKAENRTLQLKRILESLYNEKENLDEANFELLYKVIKRTIRTRSLLILFTNFENRSSLERIKPILKRLSSIHLLLVVFFENTELTEFGTQKAYDLSDSYLQSAALTMNNEKRYLTYELNQQGVHAIFTRPEELTVNALNKYLEFKSKGLI